LKESVEDAAACCRIQGEPSFGGPEEVVNGADKEPSVSPVAVEMGSLNQVVQTTDGVPLLEASPDQRSNSKFRVTEEAARVYRDPGLTFSCQHVGIVQVVVNEESAALGGEGYAGLACGPEVLTG
jgi:hypothetical protein